MKPLCPNCHKELPKFPARKGNCPFCEHTYFVKTDPDTQTKVIVDAKGVKRIEKLYRKRRNEDELEQNLKSITKDYDSLYQNIQEDLTAKWIPKFGRGPGRNDVLWGIAGELTKRAMQANDFITLSQVYFDQALYIHGEGKDCHYLLKPAKDMDIRQYAKQGVVKGVEVSAKQCCEECLFQDGEKFTFQEALDKHPIPNPQCTYKLNTEAPTGWCVCLYVADLV